MAHRRSSKRRPQGPVRSFFDTYWFELTVVGLLATGVFLLVERMEIKLSIYRAMVRLARHIAQGARSLAKSSWALLHPLEVSDIVGIVLILIALALIVWKLRLRAIRRHPTLDECPECQSVLQRVRSKPLHRLLGRLLRVRIKRYACSKCPFRATVWNHRENA